MGFIERDPSFVGERVLVLSRGRADVLWGMVRMVRMVSRAKSGRGGDGGGAGGAFDLIGFDRV